MNGETLTGAQSVPYTWRYPYRRWHVVDGGASGARRGVRVRAKRLKATERETK